MHLVAEGCDIAEPLVVAAGCRHSLVAIPAAAASVSCQCCDRNSRSARLGSFVAPTPLAAAAAAAAAAVVAATVLAAGDKVRALVAVLAATGESGCAATLT